MTASIGGSSSADYYFQLDQTLYYLTGKLGVGVWHGEGAKALGFVGEVLPETLKAAYDGFSANGLRELVQHQEGKQRQSAWDICFSCPKSLSVLWSVVGVDSRHRIEELVMEAAKRAVDYLDATALFTRRGKHGSRIEKAKGVYALIPHGTSRALDPQLHIHALCMNACLRADGTTGTIRSRDLYEHKMAAGAVFHLELAFLLLRELGLRLPPDEDNPWTFKLAGIPLELCDKQSKRREAILTLAKEVGWDSPQVMSQLAIATRKPKGFVDLGDCFEKWQATAKEFGLTQEAAEQILSQGQEQAKILSDLVVSQEKREAFLTRAVDKAIARVATTEAYFPQRKILQEANTLLQGQGYSASEVIKGVDARLAGRLPEIEIPTQAEYQFYSTKENIAAENELIERVTQGKYVDKLLASEAAVERAIKKEEQLLSKTLGVKAELTDDQKRSLRHITLEAGSVKLIQGFAGTGKTQMLNAAHRAWKEQGYHVLGCSITGKAAQGLQKATGIPSVTVAGLLCTLRPELTPKELRQTLGQQLKSAVVTEKYEAIRAGQWLKNPVQQMFRELGQAIKAAFLPREFRPEENLTNKTILVVDEVAMLPTKAFLALTQECDKVGAKFVGVGDRMQLPPIEAGGPFWSIANITGVESLNTIVRQRHAWMKQAIEHIIADRPLEALQLYVKHDSLVLAKHKAAAIDRLVEQYSHVKGHELPKVAALTSTNAEARAINQAMQEKRKAGKEFGLVSTKLPNGERVYVGDIIVLRHNDYHIGVRNGIRGTVIGIERPQGFLGPAALKIHLHGETQAGLFAWRPKIVTIDLKQYTDVQLGYAITTHMAQGITLKESMVLLGESMQSKNMAYTQLTRHTDRCMLYGTEAEWGDSLELLAKQISRSVEKDLALDYRMRCEHAQEEHNRIRLQDIERTPGLDRSLSL